MPGILPMKVIKVGSSSQSRIAQACDRCRSKKIRCDGIRPTCSQCANVGFECRTSDKLSRRAFPRGYTESLEERVRQLESEVRELKDLLDEKDEKIDMLSRLYGNRPACAARQRSPALSSSSSSEKKDSPSPQEKEDTFRVQASPLLLGVENSDSYFMGGSSGRSFIESVKRKIQENGKSCPDFNPEAFLHIQGCHPLTPAAPERALRIPPRLFTDRCVNVYFQEWAPLFPVLHKPTFLRVYEEFVADPDKVRSNHKLAQIYLVFGIAALAGEFPDTEQIAACEAEWQRALETVLMDNTVITLQCLVLALMYCTVRADYKRLQHYKGIAVGLSHRLGLHQSQKRFSFGALTIETRKKVFWTLYTLDCFSAAILGLPKLLKEVDIHAEYPADTDDEYVTEKGFQPTLPGEFTRLSSALALFRGARIVAKVLETLYPAAASHELSLQQIAALDSELTEWYDRLPDHLRLTFAQDKPSTDITGSRSPLLALAFYYTRILIQRPAVVSGLGQKTAPALMSISTSSKHIIQIIELIAERNMTFSFCLNKTDVLVICGMTLLYQGLELKQESKLLKDGQKLVNGVIKMLTKAGAPGSLDFKRISSLVVTVDEPAPPTPPQSSPAATAASSSSSSSSASLSHSQRGSPPANGRRSATPQDQSGRHPLGRLVAASVSETDLLQQQAKLRRMTMPSGGVHRPEMPRPGNNGNGRRSFDHPQGPPANRRDQRLSISPYANNNNNNNNMHSPTVLNSLDYLSLSTSPTHAPLHMHDRRQQQQQQQQQQQHRISQLYPNGSGPMDRKGGGDFSQSQWEALLASMEAGQTNVYDAIYGGPAVSLNEAQPMPAPAHGGGVGVGWLEESWQMGAGGAFNLGDFDGGGGGGSAAPQSVLSMSEESLSPAEDMKGGGGGGGGDLPPLDVGGFDMQGSMMPGQCGAGDGYMNGPDGHFII